MVVRSRRTAYYEPQSACVRCGTRKRYQSTRACVRCVQARDASRTEDRTSHRARCISGLRKAGVSLSGLSDEQVTEIIVDHYPLMGEYFRRAGCT